MPLFRRIPKRGFSNALFKKHFAVVNIKELEARFDKGAEVNPDMLVKVGLIPDTKLPVKVMGEGDVTKPLQVTVAAISKSAGEKIVAAGGSVVATGWHRPQRKAGGAG